MQLTSPASRLRALARRYRVSDVYVFGSRAAEIAALIRGEAPKPSQPDSDVDIGVFPLPGALLSAAERVGLAIELEDLFGAPRVDLVVLPEAPPYLALDVVAGELLHSEAPDLQAEYELYVLRRAGDLAPFEQERRRMILTGDAR